MNNFFQINDWNYRKFFTIVFSLQLAMTGLIALDMISLEITLLRQLIGFIYVAFIPGFIILRVLKLHNLGNIETILYSVGLSLSFVMFLGFFMNKIYPLFGILNPISIWPLIFTYNIVILLLCLVGYIRDRDFSNKSLIKEKISYTSVLFLCLIPFLSVFGAYSLNIFHNSSILKILIIVLSSMYIVIGFKKIIPNNLYPLAIFVIALSLLYHKSLISMTLWGTDIQNEYYYSNSIIQNGLWESSTYGNLNAMLSIVMLAPIWSIISDMSVIWIFKIIYPFLFSLAPLGLYRVFQKQTSDVIAFFSCVFFMSVHMFYSIMLEVARQQIAQFFLVLLLLLIVNENMDKFSRKVLLIIFSFSLITSHYGVSYIWMFSIIIAWLLIKLNMDLTIQKTINILRLKYISKEKEVENYYKTVSLKNNSINSNILMLFAVFIVSWYIYISGSSSFNSFITVVDKFISGLTIDFLNPNDIEALNIITLNMSPLHDITKYLHIITQFMMSIGIISILFGLSERRLNREFFVLSLIFYAICIVSLILPETSVRLGTSRAYMICLTLIAPFFVIGFVDSFNKIYIIVHKSQSYQNSNRVFKYLAVFLSIFLLFNSGFVYEIADDDPTSIALNPNIKNMKFNDDEVYAASWLGHQTQSNVYAGDVGRFVVYNYIKHTRVNVIKYETSNIPKKTYIFLDSFFLNKGQLVVSFVNSNGIVRESYNYLDSIFYSNVITISSKIYDNGNANVYYLS